MVTITGPEREVLMYLKSSLHHNKFDGVKASEIASNIDQPVKDVIDSCEKLEQKDLVAVEKRHMDQGAVRDLEVHIKSHGLDFLAKEKGIPL